MSWSMETTLGWMMAVAWLGLFCWMVWKGLFGLLEDPRSHLKTFAAQPVQYLLLSAMITGLMLFLFWLVSAPFPVSIDHIRPLGIPLGLWGFGVAGLCLPFMRF